MVCWTVDCLARQCGGDDSLSMEPCGQFAATVQDLTAVQPLVSVVILTDLE